MNLFNFLNIERILIQIGLKRPKRVGIKLDKASNVTIHNSHFEGHDIAIDAKEVSGLDAKNNTYQ